MSRAALLLVDLQQDFLRREGLSPAAGDIVERCVVLLEGFRERGLPVIHGRTRVARDGHDRMPHWVESGAVLCVEGSPGEAPPPELAETSDEPVVRKQFYSVFDVPELDAWLYGRDVQVLVIAGIYTHGCVRAAVLDGYRRGYRIRVARDAIGSSEPLHAEITRDYLHGRAAEFLGTREILRRLAGSVTAPAHGSTRASAACIDGHWREATDGEGGYRHDDPARPDEIVSHLAFAPPALVQEAVAAAQRAQPSWASLPLTARCRSLTRWKAALDAGRDTIVACMVREIGKPRAAAMEEFGRALKHIETSLRLAADAAPIAAGVEVAYRALGVVALVTPWNNPVAIPVAKLAAALIQGNTVVWKPASQSALCARLVLDALNGPGLPVGLCQVLHGDAECVRELVRQPGIAAVSMTGSERAGAQLRAWCSMHDKPLQAELGGNNAAIVLADADLDAAIAALVPAVYSFSGQRCTAIRRLIVEAPLAQAFRERWCAAAAALRVGLPDDDATELGPLISRRQRQRVDAAVRDAQRQGARCWLGGRESAPGFAYLPTLIECADANAAIVQQETFGPIAVLQVAEDAAHAVGLANAVPQGLLGAVFTRDTPALREIGDALQVGILRLAGNIQRLDADAPFGGWKSSQVGPPEHGEWDRHFFSRPQARYGAAGS